MQKSIAASSFTRLADDLKRPFAPPLEEGKSQVPLVEEEMIARYGMRRLSAEERSIFPGLTLVIQAKKVRITHAPTVLPRAKGWVVWIAETYPGWYLVKLPGGGSLIAPYNEMNWADVAQDMPATTLAYAKEAERQQRWQRAFRQNIGQQLVVG